jgi:hypothetical protein
MGNGQDGVDSALPVEPLLATSTPHSAKSLCKLHRRTCARSNLPAATCMSASVSQARSNSSPSSALYGNLAMRYRVGNGEQSSGGDASQHGSPSGFGDCILLVHTCMYSGRAHTRARARCTLSWLRALAGCRNRRNARESASSTGTQLGSSPTNSSSCPRATSTSARTALAMYAYARSTCAAVDKHGWL